MKMLAVTSCPSGVAHTYMAAEAIENAAKERGWECKVETQGADGIENRIEEADLEGVDFVLLTNDIAIKEEERFTKLGVQIVRVGVAEVVKKAPQILDKIEQHLAVSPIG